MTFDIVWLFRWKASEARRSLHDLQHGRWGCHGCYDRWHHVAEALRSCCHQPCSIMFLRLLRWRNPAVGTLVRAHTERFIPSAARVLNPGAFQAESIPLEPILVAEGIAGFGTLAAEGIQLSRPSAPVAATRRRSGRYFSRCSACCFTCFARARFLLLLCPQGKPVTRSAGLGNPSW